MPLVDTERKIWRMLTSFRTRWGASMAGAALQVPRLKWRRAREDCCARPCLLHVPASPRLLVRVSFCGWWMTMLGRSDHQQECFVLITRLSLCIHRCRGPYQKHSTGGAAGEEVSKLRSTQRSAAAKVGWVGSCYRIIIIYNLFSCMEARTFIRVSVWRGRTAYQAWSWRLVQLRRNLCGELDEQSLDVSLDAGRDLATS